MENKFQEWIYNKTVSRINSERRNFDDDWVMVQIDNERYWKLYQRDIDNYYGYLKDNVTDGQALDAIKQAQYDVLTSIIEDHKRSKAEKAKQAAEDAIKWHNTSVRISQRLLEEAMKNCRATKPIML